MAEKTALWRVGAGVAAGAVLLTACSGSDNSSEDPTDSTAVEVGSFQPERNDTLDIGFIYDQTGPLAFLTPPQPAAMELAVEDINAAGGVNGHDVTVETGDEGGDPSIVRETAAKFVNDNKDAVIGAAASGMSQEFIQLLYDHRIVQCSGSNTSPTFSTQENNTYYFRTVPPDEAVAPLIAEWIVEEENHSTVAVVFRDDDYGRALEELIVAGVDERGASVAARIGYEPDTEDFSSVVEEIVAADADAVALIAFEGAVPILAGSFAAGLEPEQFYGSDGLYGTYIADFVLEAAGETEEGNNPVSGVTVFGAGGDAEFNERLSAQLPEDLRTNTAYGGQTYDCAIVIALAAVAADSVDPWVFYEYVADVTKGGTKCTSFAECAELLNAGEDIDYDGPSGALEITHPDPTIGGYAIAQFRDDGTLGQIADRDVDLTDLGG